MNHLLNQNEVYIILHTRTYQIKVSRLATAADTQTHTGTHARRISNKKLDTKMKIKKLRKTSKINSYTVFWSETMSLKLRGDNVLNRQ